MQISSLYFKQKYISAVLCSFTRSLIIYIYTHIVKRLCDRVTYKIKINCTNCKKSFTIKMLHCYRVKEAINNISRNRKIAISLIIPQTMHFFIIEAKICYLLYCSYMKYYKHWSTTNTILSIMTILHYKPENNCRV